jgi:hypothetical protein
VERGACLWTRSPPHSQSALRQSHSVMTPVLAHPQIPPYLVNKILENICRKRAPERL